jgi:hypothetical protein
VSDKVSHPYKTTGKIIAPYILIFEIFYSKLKGSAKELSAYILTIKNINIIDTISIRMASACNV